MKKILLSIILLNLLMVSGIARADDKDYHAPQMLTHCHLDSAKNPVCDPFDNSFLELGAKSITTFGGDYTFQNAYVHIKSGFYTIVYIYKNKQDDIAGLYTAFTIPRAQSPEKSQWRTVDDQLQCNDPLAKNCPYTRTPWTVTSDNILVAALGHYNQQKNYHVATSIPTSFTIVNNSDFPITLHKDDYNSVDFQFEITQIAAHSSKEIMKDLQPKEKAVLMFDVQLGEGLRNSNNTTVIVSVDNAVLLDNDEHMIDGKDIELYYNIQTSTITIDNAK